MSKPSQKKHAKRHARTKAIRKASRAVPGQKKTTRAGRALKKIDETWAAACNVAEASGDYTPETIHCMRVTGLMLTSDALRKGEASEEEIKHWAKALTEYRAAHPEEQITNEKGKRVSHG